MDRVGRNALFSTILNIIFSAFYIAMGIMSESLWLLILGTHNFVFGAIGTIALTFSEEKVRISEIAGWMMLLLSMTMILPIFISVSFEAGYRFQLVLILAIATLSFYKVILATINLIKAKCYTSEKIITLRSVSFADGLVSIFALQRSMIASFEGMTEIEALAMNLSVGAAVSIAVFITGMRLIKVKHSIAEDE